MLLTKRFASFYLNYWPVFIIWVSIGILFYHRSPIVVYEESGLIKGFITDILAIRGMDSYNVTWWFNKLIVQFYLISPIIFMLTKRFPLSSILLVLLI